jgi:hypothetical protein
LVRAGNRLVWRTAGGLAIKTNPVLNVWRSKLRPAAPANHGLGHGERIKAGKIPGGRWAVPRVISNTDTDQCGPAIGAQYTAHEAIIAWFATQIARLLLDIAIIISALLRIRLRIGAQAVLPALHWVFRLKSLLILALGIAKQQREQHRANGEKCCQDQWCRR